MFNMMLNDHGVDMFYAVDVIGQEEDRLRGYDAEIVQREWVAFKALLTEPNTSSRNLAFAGQEVQLIEFYTDLVLRPDMQIRYRDSLFTVRAVEDGELHGEEFTRYTAERAAEA